MVRSILITGGSGYLGGSLLAHLAAHRDQIPADARLYALVRSAEQAAAAQAYGAEGLSFDAYDAAAVSAAVVGHDISVVFWLVDAFHATAQMHFVAALAAVGAKTGLPVHFLHTSGAKIFSDMAGAPANRAVSDSDAGLYAIQKAQEATVPPLNVATATNNKVIDEAEAKGVRAYIFVPCIVYGKGLGFGNKISIQTVAVVKAAMATRRVYKVDTDRAVWPVSHVADTTALYFQLLRAILLEQQPDHGRNGYYLAAAGSVAWQDIYGAMAVPLARRSIVDSAAVELADDAALEKMGAALGVPEELVRLNLGGVCTLTADHGRSLGWTSQYPPTHILEAAEAEVDLILEALTGTARSPEL